VIIAFDTMLLSGRYRNSGIHEYAKNLFSQFRTLLREDSSVGVRYFVLPRYSDASMDWQSSPGYQAVETSLLQFHRLWQLGLASVAATRVKADVIFSPGPTILPSKLLPVAVTIHDAMPVRLPTKVVPKSALSRMATWISAKRSQKVLTDSEHSKRDLMEIYNLPSQKISVIYLGYNRAVFNSLPANSKRQGAVLARLALRRPFILHHGMVQLRKNLGRLIDAYRILRERNSSFDAQLVLAGDFGWGARELLQQANGSIERGDIVFTGALPEEELALLIKAATLCVIPSLYEGFCLPVVEAMACGVPTITSNSSCLPEVSGGILRYFDPMAADDMAAKIEEALDDSELRAGLASAGLKRASEFSWQRCAQQTLQALKEFDG
jgi:glycosyltransferase involved in cell wall biosynthesis